MGRKMTLLFAVVGIVFIFLFGMMATSAFIENQRTIGIILLLIMFGVGALVIATLMGA
jgi:hypothetical protein